MKISKDQRERIKEEKRKIESEIAVFIAQKTDKFTDKTGIPVGGVVVNFKQSSEVGREEEKCFLSYVHVLTKNIF